MVVKWNTLQPTNQSINQSIQAMFRVQRTAFRGATKSCPLQCEQQGPGSAQVVHTHRTWCRRAWPRGFGELNPSPHFWIFTFVSVGSSPRSYLFTSATGRIGVWRKIHSICNAPRSRSARRSFAPSQKSRRHTVFVCERKPFPVWF